MRGDAVPIVGQANRPRNGQVQRITCVGSKRTAFKGENQMSDLRSPQKLTSCRHPLEAEMLANHLKAAGIDARTTNTTISNGAIEFALIDPEVLVPAEQIAVAQTLLEEFRADSDVDWDTVDVGEPEDAEEAAS